MTEQEHTTFTLHTEKDVAGKPTPISVGGNTDYVMVVESKEIGIRISRRQVTIFLSPQLSKSVEISPDGTRFSFSVGEVKPPEPLPESGSGKTTSTTICCECGARRIEPKTM